MSLPVAKASGLPNATPPRLSRSCRAPDATVDSEQRWRARRALVIAAGVVVLAAALALAYALTGSDDSFDPARYQRVASECEASTDRSLETDGLELDGMTAAQRDEWIKVNNACLKQRLGDVPLTTTGDAVDGS